MRKHIFGMAAGFLIAAAGLARAQPNVVAWGSGSVTNVPSDLTNAISVYAGHDQAIALCDDGRVVAWGENGYGQTDVPVDLGTVVQVVAGNRYSAALKDDGTVRWWGSFSELYTNALCSLTNVAEIEGVTTNAMAVRHCDGTVQIVGDNGGFMPNITNAVAVVGTGMPNHRPHYMALLATGKVVCWGDGMTKVAKWATNVVGIAMTTNMNSAVRADGYTVTWNPISPPATAVNGTLTDPVAVQISGNATAVYTVKSNQDAIKVVGVVDVPEDLPPVIGASAGNGFGVAILAP